MATSDFLRDLNFYDVFDVMLNEDYFTIIFPFLLIYAILYTVFSRLSIFKNKKTNKPNKPVAIILALIVTLFAVVFEISPGYTISRLIAEMFPNISAIGIGIVILYILGGLFGKNFFKGLFSKSQSSIFTFIVGGIMFGMVIYYVGIATGFLEREALDTGSMWNMIVLIGTLVTGVILVIAGTSPGSGRLIIFGALLIFVDIAYIYNGANENILEYYFDPIVFIVLVATLMYGWTMSKDEKVSVLEKKIKNSEQSYEKYVKELGREPQPYESRIADLIKEGLDENKKELEKLRKK
jgi:hypothetical protein